MAKKVTTKTTYSSKKKYYWKRKKNYTADTFFNCKLEWNGLIRFPDNNAGSPLLWYNGNGYAARTFNQLLEASNTVQNPNAYALLNRLFSYMRVRGVLIEVTPSIRNAGASSAVVSGNQVAGVIVTNIEPVYIGVLWGTTLSVTDAEIRASNSCFQLNPLQKTRKYISGHGGSNDYKTTIGSNGYPGVVQLSGGSGVYSDSPVWSLKVTFYIRYKIQKTI